MRQYDSEIYGSVPSPRTFEDLHKIIASPHETSGRVRMWRGQADISWPVHSGAYRRVSLEAKVVQEVHLRGYETRLIKKADHQGYRILDGRALSDLELLARLQHHGAATRLIDASRSALVALWFAVASHPTKTGVLLGLHSWKLGGYEGERDDRAYADVAKGLEPHEHPMTWEPTAVSPRIAAQHAQFLYSKVIDSKTGSLCLPPGYGTLAVAITPPAKRLFQDLLKEVYDIHHRTLFPDLDGFCSGHSSSIPQFAMDRW